MIPDWLQQALTLDEDDGLDIIYSRFYSWFEESAFEETNAIFSGLTREDIAEIPLLFGIGLLSASSVAAHLLPDRDRVYDLIQEVWAEELEPGDLDGLRGPNLNATEARNVVFSVLLGSKPIPTEK